jgi:hypothetical protein
VVHVVGSNTGLWGWRKNSTTVRNSDCGQPGR